MHHDPPGQPTISSVVWNRSIAGATGTTGVTRVVWQRLSAHSIVQVYCMVSIGMVVMRIHIYKTRRTLWTSSLTPVLQAFSVPRQAPQRDN